MSDLEEIYRVFKDCGSVTTDSRNVPENALFFGLKGDHYDGNRFASEALHKGAAYAIVDSTSVAISDKYILVEDALATLQALAHHHRQNSSASIIAITGSNGKTTTKELIGAILSKAYRTVTTRGNLNNHIGVPLTLLTIQEDTEMVVLEMGANHPGEIAHLCNIGNPDYGIITNIGKAHLEGFGGFEGVVRAKSELYDYLRQNQKQAFVNRDNELLWRISEGIRRISYGSSPDATCRGSIHESNPFLQVYLTGELQGSFVKTNLVGGYNFENVMAAVCIGKQMNVPEPLIIKAIESYTPQNNRSQRFDTGKNILFLDAYNANPSSMQAALENFSKFVRGDKMLILGDMMELGEDSLAEHREIIRLIDTMAAGRIILVGDFFRKAAEGTGIACFPDIDAARAYLSKLNLKNHTILIKGSRKMQLEKLTDLL